MFSDITAFSLREDASIRQVQKRNSVAGEVSYPL